MKKRAGTKKKHGHNMIPFLIVMAVIPWAIILMVTYLLYRRVKPQLRLLWANAKAVWAAQHAAQAAPTYHKQFWKDHKFPGLKETEDVHFLQAAEAANQQDMCFGHNLLVCRRHGTNTWAYNELKAPIPTMKENELFLGLRRVRVESLPQGFISAMGITFSAPSVPHAHKGYCRKHKQLGCPSCTNSSEY